MNVVVCSGALCFVNLPCRRAQPVLVVSEKMGAEYSIEDDHHCDGEKESLVAIHISLVLERKSL